MKTKRTCGDSLAKIIEDPLSANMNETVTRKKISVEGESGNECGEWK
jgi:hypothetical protein